MEFNNSYTDPKAVTKFGGQKNHELNPSRLFDKENVSPNYDSFRTPPKTNGINEERAESSVQSPHEVWQLTSPADSESGHLQQPTTKMKTSQQDSIQRTVSPFRPSSFPNSPHSPNQLQACIRPSDVLASQCLKNQSIRDSDGFVYQVQFKRSRRYFLRSSHHADFKVKCLLLCSESLSRKNGVKLVLNTHQGFVLEVGSIVRVEADRGQGVLMSNSISC